MYTAFEFMSVAKGHVTNGAFFALPVALCHSRRKTAMRGPTSVKWLQIKPVLASLDKPELIALLKDLFDHSLESRAFLSARFLAEGVPNAILDRYRKRIVEQFFPKRGDGKLDLRSARRAICDYRKATSDLAGTVDLMLIYVESGTEFTNQFGDALGTATSTSLSTTASNPCWMQWSAC
jgi:hypothetical protein